MRGEPRQPSYVDLSDAQFVRFGGECGICGARYASAPVPLQGADSAQVRDLRKTALSQFDAAWRDLQVSCYRCGRGACPECWDVESRMCVECADARGLARAPYAPPTRGPLVDGRLVLTERGKYSRVEQPAWMGDLMASSPPPAATGNGAGTIVESGHVQPWMLALTTTGDLARETYPDAPFVPVTTNTLVSAPTEQIPTAPNSQPLPPPSVPPDDGEFSFSAPTATGPGNASMITCPRCGTANYDFVTQCTACQLQLVQLCPVCDKLNLGQATRCESCGSPLSRPRGWSGVLPPLSPQIIAAMKRDADASSRASAPSSGPIAARDGAQQGHESGLTESTRIVPYLASSRSLTPSTPSPATYTPGGQVAVPTIPPPPRERGKRRRPPGASGGASGVGSLATPAPVTPLPLVTKAPGRVGTAVAVLDRVSGWILVAVVFVFVGMIVAAEVSPGANAALRGIIHIDIRQTLAQFVSQIQMLWQRVHH